MVSYMVGTSIQVKNAIIYNYMVIWSQFIKLTFRKLMLATDNNLPSGKLT